MEKEVMRSNFRCGCRRPLTQPGEGTCGDYVCPLEAVEAFDAMKNEWTPRGALPSLPTPRFAVAKREMEDVCDSLGCNLIECRTAFSG